MADHFDEPKEHAKILEGFRVEIGRRIKSLRTDSKLSQQAVADAIGVTVQAVSQWEKGKSSPDIVKMSILASFFKTNVGYIFVGSEDNTDFFKTPDKKEFPALKLSNAYDYFYNKDINIIEANSAYKKIIPTNASSSLQMVFEIDDDSMRPIFDIGDIIIIETALFPLPGDYVVYIIRDDKKFKFRKFRLKSTNIDAKHLMEFYPLNTDYPSDTAADTSEATVEGTMVEHRRFRRRK